MAVIRLTGVWDDGSPLVAPVPANPRVEIELVQNATTEILLDLVTPSGAKKDIDLTIPGNRVSFIGNAGGVDLIGILATKDAPGLYRFLITPAQTRDLRPRRFLYNIFAIEGSVQMPAIPLSPAVLIAGLL